MVIMVTTIILGLPLLLSAQSAHAAWSRLVRKEGVFGGYCPTGTCSRHGKWHANNVKNCKKENCPKGYKDAPR
jgi:hypothetical protein